MNPIIKKVRKFRRNLGLKRSKFHEAILRKSRAGKLDTREEMAAYFATLWPLAPSKSSAQAKTVDLMEMLEPFSPAERRAIVKRTEAIQLTQGCNGKCYFCSFGLKNGVTAKFSYDSLKSFLHTYGKLTLDGQGFALYHDSDPFDYQDGAYDFLDVFRLVQENALCDNFISTALPIGSEASFVCFIEEVIQTNPKHLNVRISLSAKNAVRIETVLTLVHCQLRVKGMPEIKINQAFTKLFEIEFRKSKGRSIRPIGENLIGKADPLKDSGSPCCADGVILAPECIKAVISVAVSRFCPSGEVSTQLTPDDTFSKIPKDSYRDILLSLLDPVGWYLAVKARHPYSIFLPPPMSYYDNEYHLVFAEMKELTKARKYSLYLARNNESLRTFLAFVGELTFRRANPGTIRTMRYLRAAEKVYRQDVQRLYEEVLSGAEEVFAGLENGDDKEELGFFITLARANTTLVESVFALTKAKLAPLTITFVAYRLGDLTLEGFTKLEAQEGGVRAWAIKFGRQTDTDLKESRRKRKQRRKAKRGDP